MMKEVFSGSKECGNCPKCLSHYLAGREQCSDCKTQLDQTLFRGKKRKLKTTPSLLATIMNPMAADDDFESTSWEDDDSFKPPIKWNDPATINMVGFVVCLVILISTFSV